LPAAGKGGSETKIKIGTAKTIKSNAVGKNDAAGPPPSSDAIFLPRKVPSTNTRATSKPMAEPK
jgi:hypothetical protein